ncbi:non-ribosomal peptide synthetase [Chitinophaga sp. MD30]|uniref:non-ribosomal peptide synthetase n=1 Tax=Chitinophaga sp. MD30 TaxID=2033437 RepID=UPI0018E03883|nr:non-ribosomal peptide synthetase [Chitinophaga sp. MD30]
MIYLVRYESCRLLAVTTFCFDIAYLEFFLPLLSGGTVLVSSRSGASDAYLLMDQLSQYRPTHMQATPATWHMLQESGWERPLWLEVLVGGEALPWILKEQLTAGGGCIWNVYGPTEATIWASIKALYHGDAVTIGQGLHNTPLYILDEAGGLCPPGVIGEICIGGPQVGRGYLYREDLSAGRFVSDPFLSGGRLYRTGDLGRLHSTGDIQCLGRKDEQVKIRGYRIELGEIENVLQRCEQVRTAAVVAHADTSGMKRLVAYVVPEKEFEQDRIVSVIRKQLPEYMVPSLFIPLTQLPLTPNGKVDRKALPYPDAHMSVAPEYVPARNETEKLLVAIWQELLERDQIGIYDDFFFSGGHSLLAMRVGARIRQELALQISVDKLFQFKDIAQLSEYIHALQAGHTAGNTSSEVFEL